jgi:hypothetical protein
MSSRRLRMSSISDGEAFRAVRRFFAGRFAVGIWRVSMDLTLFTDQLTLTQSERRRVTGVEEDESTGSSLRWFVCRLCGHRRSVAPKKHARRSSRVFLGDYRRHNPSAPSSALSRSTSRSTRPSSSAVGRTTS